MFSFKQAGMVVAAAAAAVAVLIPGAAGAALIPVTTTKDEFGAGGTKKCALREAVEAANTNSKFGGCAKGSGKDTVLLGPGRFKLKFDGADDDNEIGDLDVDSPLAILGAGRDKSVIDANGSVTKDRAIDQLSGALTVANVTIRNGHETEGYGGGGILGRDEAKALTVKNARLAHNLTDDGNGGGLYVLADADLPVKVINTQVLENDAYDYGGGISSDHAGDLIVQRSLISGNDGDYGPGGIHAQQEGQFRLLHSTVSDNTGAEYGGGIEIDGGSTLIQDSTITRNSVAGYDYNGGGIYDEGNDDTARIIRSTISGNSTNGSGGGLYLEYGDWIIQNSTISHNSAGYDYGYGGGIYNAGAEASLNGVTVTQNIGSNGYGGIEDGASGVTEFRNSIVADNRDYYYDTDYDCSAAESLGHNLIGDGSCSPLGSDEIGTDGDAPLDAMLMPLGPFGGPTKTHALIAGSPAINLGRNCLPSDQRGHKRKKAKCDAGAFER